MYLKALVLDAGLRAGAGQLPIPKPHSRGWRACGLGGRRLCDLRHMRHSAPDARRAIAAEVSGRACGAARIPVPTALQAADAAQATGRAVRAHAGESVRSWTRLVWGCIGAHTLYGGVLMRNACSPMRFARVALQAAALLQAADVAQFPGRAKCFYIGGQAGKNVLCHWGVSLEHSYFHILRNFAQERDCGRTMLSHRSQCQTWKECNWNFIMR